MRAGYLWGSSAPPRPTRAGITWEEFLLPALRPAPALVGTEGSEIPSDRWACATAQGPDLGRGLGYAHAVEVGSGLPCQLQPLTRCLRQIPFALGAQSRRWREALCDGDSQRETQSSVLFSEFYPGGACLSPWAAEEPCRYCGCNKDGFLGT